MSIQCNLKTNWRLVEGRPPIFTVPERITKQIEAAMATSNETTVKSFKDIWLKNLPINKKLIGGDFRKFGIYQFKDKNVGETAYLIGAGTSLKRNVQKLKYKNGIKITNAHCLKYLLNYGITPDFVLILDAKDKQVDWIDIGSEAKNIKLCIDTCVDPGIIRKWKGQIFFFRANAKAEDEFSKKSWEIDSDFTDILSCGGNVMGGCLTFAIGLGCKKVVFIGMDLACNVDNPVMQYKVGYCTGEDDGEGVDSFLDVNIEGLGIMTLGRMYDYKHWIDCLSINPHITCKKIDFINASEGGILGAYVEGNLKSIKQMKLEEV